MFLMNKNYKAGQNTIRIINMLLTKRLNYIKTTAIQAVLYGIRLSCQSFMPLPNGFRLSAANKRLIFMKADGKVR